MKKYLSWKLLAGISLLILSILVYLIHFFVFRDAHHLFIYLIGDIGFMFLEIFLVVLVIEHLLDKREKRSLIKKLNMLIGVFFSEIGLLFFRKFSKNLKNINSLGCSNIKMDWKKRDYIKLRKNILSKEFNVNISREELKELYDFFNLKKQLLLSLLENPNLIEHDRFTDMLWAVFHMFEELGFREDLLKIPEDDLEHLVIDFERVYKALVIEWVNYLEHLSCSYPFLFSLALRKNIDLGT